MSGRRARQWLRQWERKRRRQTKAVRDSIASPRNAHLKHDVFYAREKMALEITGWAHWDTEAGHELKDTVFSEVHELVSSQGSFEALDAALQGLYNHVDAGE
ncbi:hypothetical protein ACFVY0_34065 [Streptomyces sp. NPDC058286]|uniref:hypothetical protein n=1 Tax=Streptomyces sp. NPDC058286 TaxID=3346422 RepID=UPI0036F0B9CC